MPHPLLAGRHIRLVPVGPEHYDFLRMAEVAHLGRWWRSRGAVQSPEEFARRIWNGTLAQFLALGTDDGLPRLWLQCYAAEEAHDIASFALARLDDGHVSLRAASGAAAFIEYCFSSFSLRKLYIEVAQPNLDLFRSVAGPLFMEEGRLREHLRVGDRYEDLVLLTLWRDHWASSEIRDRLLSRL